jgi:competence protein ComEC
MLRTAVLALPARLRLPEAVLDVLHAQHGRYVLWLPVFMGSGTLGYFALRTEPPVWAGLAVFLPAALGATLARPWPVLRALLLVLSAASLGFASAQLATLRALPVEKLPSKSVWLTGTVLGVETLPVGSRVLLGEVRLDGADGKLARSLRIRLREGDPPASAGDTLRLRALLRAPSPPAYPGGWDLQRDAFFSGLGGYGFALGHSQVVATGTPSGFSRQVQALRDAIARRIEAALPPDRAGIAATLLTGNAAAIPEGDHQAFRDSGLAHLLAVAGLHIGIVMGLIMGLVRTSLAASERAALFWPIKEIAAVCALVAGGCYMLLTGMHVPIMRSFAMACLFTLGVLLGRRAISVRGLALAATALMLFQPAQVPGVSFQMSFSAVLALIAGYEALRPHLHSLYGRGGAGRRFLVHATGLALTSLLAGVASAPFGAYHFGRIQLYFIPSNMLAVPLTAFWVMPAGLIALALMPFHMEWLALTPMGWGIAGIVWIARTCSSWPDATLPAPPIPDWGMLVLSLGMAWLGLWRGRVRLAGVALIALGLVSPAFLRLPDILVSADARLIALRTPARIYVQAGPGAAAFTLDSWTQFFALPEAAMPDTGTAGDGAVVCTAAICLLHGVRGGTALLARKTVPPEACAGPDALVSAEPARHRCPDLPLVDRFTVWRQGSTAIWLDPGTVRIVTDRGVRGDRPWVPPPPRPAREAQPREAQPREPQPREPQPREPLAVPRELP